TAHVQRLAIEIRACELAVARHLLRLSIRLVWPIPLVPPVGPNVRPHLRANECDSGVASAVPLPWPSQIRRDRISCERAVEKHITDRMIRRRASCGYV